MSKLHVFPGRKIWAKRTGKRVEWSDVASKSRVGPGKDYPTTSAADDAADSRTEAGKRAVLA